MKRLFFLAAIMISAVSTQAQLPMMFDPGTGIQPGVRQFNHSIDSGVIGKKWFFTKYAGISTGFIGFNGGNSTFLSAPMSIQINRQLTNNVIAFAGLSVTPSYFHYNSPLYQPATKMNKGFMNVNQFDAYPAAQMGLMYINNERTFSISGSIGVRRSSYNYYQTPFYNPASPAIPGRIPGKF